MSKVCPLCGMEIPNSASICPYCREKQHDGDMSVGAQLFWCLVVILIAAGLMIWFIPDLQWWNH